MHNINNLNTELYPIIGVDEVGRGPLSGPVVVCAFFLDNVAKIPPHVDDSKKISPKNRIKLENQLTRNFIYGIGVVSNKIIDEINILQATYRAMHKAVDDLQNKLINKYNQSIHNCTILVDGRDNPFEVEYSNSKAIIGGDGKIAAISAASIIAKVYRDNLMTKLSKAHPQYKWHKNAGYGTKEHRDAIKEYGITEYHRKTFLKSII